MRYLIHACNDRLWYVDEFLIPSMLVQGIERKDISVWLDKESKGNLFSCMDSFLDCGKYNCGTWHLQDDVIIARGFARRTAKDCEEVVCGFCGKEVGPHPEKFGHVQMRHMWFSFQCIYIPNYLAFECADWFYSEGRYEERFKERIAEGKSDDYFWLRFMVENHRDDVDCCNLKPNLVDHVDYLLGGSVINKSRKRDNTSAYFNDHDLIEQLREEIEKRERKVLLSDDCVTNIC